MPEQIHNQENLDSTKVLDQLYVLDFDRTLADSTRLNELLFLAADMCNYDVEDIKRREIAQRGNSFNTLAELKKLIHHEGGIEQVKETFLALCDQLRDADYSDGGFMEPHSRDFLEGISSDHMMVLTYGSDTEWQEWKLEAAGLDEGYHIIATGKDEQGNPITKPELLTEAYDDKKKAFTFTNVRRRQEPIMAKSVTIVDDKLENLRGLPDHAKGVWYIPWRNSLRKREKMLAEVKNLPARVKVMRKLSRSAIREASTNWPAFREAA